MITENFKKFAADMIGVQVDLIESLHIVNAYSVDARRKKPCIYENAIMFWCWLRSKRLRKIGWKKRWHHCAGVEIWRALLTNGIVVKFSVSYDASYKYERNDFKKWIKDYDIINICDTYANFGIVTEQDKLKIHTNYEKMIGTPYGKTSIGGLVIDDITRLQVIGVNGKEKVICSESEMWVYMDFIPVPNEPRDFIDVIERGKYFIMVSYEGELNRFM